MSSTDPVEQIIDEALSSGGFTFWRDAMPRPGGPSLDFEVQDGPFIEVKRFYTPRADRQLQVDENVILIQGIDAARWFAGLIKKREFTGATPEIEADASGEEC